MQEERKDLEVLWSPKNVAKYLGMSEVTIYRWLSKKKVFDSEKIVRISNRVRIPRSEVERVAGITKSKLMGEIINHDND